MTIKNNLLIITTTHALGCATSAIRLFSKQLDRKLFTVHLMYLDQTDYPSIYRYIDTEKITVVLTNSIFFCNGQAYKDTLDLLRHCKTRHISVVDIAHFARFDPVVDSLLYRRLFVSQTLLLKYCLIAQKHKLPITKYNYLYNPIDISHSTVDFRQQHKKTFTIGRIGRANIDKWDSCIVELTPYLLKHIPNCKILIQSMPKDRESAIPKAIRSYIKILPESSDRQKVLQTISACDVLVQTSTIGESFGCAIAEGMLLGKPIITNSTDFLALVSFDRDNAQTELVTDTVNGFIENTPKLMANRIIELYQNQALYRKISQENIEKAATLFNVEKLTNRLEDFLLQNDTKLVTLPLSLTEYKKRVKQESLSIILGLNMRYLLRRFRRKLTHLGLLECC